MTDLSDAGSEPTGNNGAGTANDSTTFTQSAILVEETISNVVDNGDGSFSVTYSVVVSNAGTDPLTNVELAGTPSTDLSAAITAVATDVTITNGSAIAGSYAVNGSSNLITGGSLPAGGTIEFNYVLELLPSNAADASNLLHDVAVSGVDSNAATVTATDDALYEQAEIGAAKDISVVDNGDGSFTATFTVVASNTGTETLSNVILTDVASAELVSASSAIAADIALQTGSLNGSLGTINIASASNTLLSGQTLATGESISVVYSLVIVPADATDPTAISNQVSAAGDFTDSLRNNGTVTDLSDAGTDVLGNNGNGTADDATAFVQSGVQVSEQITNTVDNGDGSFNVSYQVTVTNTGTDTLSNAVLASLPNANLDAATSAIVSDVAITGGTAATNVTAVRLEPQRHGDCDRQRRCNGDRY